MLVQGTYNPDLWRRTLSLSGGGTISSFQREGGRTAGNISSQTYTNGKEELFRRFTDSFCADHPTIYRGLTENMLTLDLDEFSKSVLECIDSNHYDLILVATGTDAYIQILKKLNSKKFLEACRAHGKKIVVMASNHPLSNPDSDGWETIEKSFIGGHDKSMPPGTYAGFHGEAGHELFPASDADYLPFLMGTDTAMHLGSPTSDSFQRRKARIDELTSLELVELGITLDKNPGVMVIKACKIRNDLSKIKAEITRTKPKAVILTLYHSGTACTREDKPEASWAKLVEEFSVKGIPFFGCTLNGEPTDLTLYETSTALKKAGVIPTLDLLPKVALAKITHGVSKNMPPNDLIDFVLPSSSSLYNSAHISALKDLYVR